MQKLECRLWGQVQIEEPGLPVALMVVRRSRHLAKHL